MQKEIADKNYSGGNHPSDDRIHALYKISHQSEAYSKHRASNDNKCNWLKDAL
jgi:hypothetical protein